VTWSPDPDAYIADLEAKPAALRALAAVAGDVWAAVPPDVRRVVLVGMGSSRFAASVAAARLRALGVDAVAEYASAEVTTPGGPGTLAVGISASGGTDETVRALRRHSEAGSLTAALTNAPDSKITEVAATTVDLAAGQERGGMACRTFQHALVRLLALEDRLADRPKEAGARRILAAAEATEDLLERRAVWLPAAVDLLTATGRTFLLAPVERSSSAEQGALLFREGPRLHADACETGDWLHVDVYLTKPLDYRALLFAGSRFDPAVLRWARERGSTVLAVGADIEGAAGSIRYADDDAPEVALLTETLVPELVAAEAWRA
jgi:fructoselysine-6-P-deglycase FrlB-like protein